MNTLLRILCVWLGAAVLASAQVVTTVPSIAALTNRSRVLNEVVLVSGPWGARLARHSASAVAQDDAFRFRASDGGNYHFEDEAELVQDARRWVLIDGTGTIDSTDAVNAAIAACAGKTLIFSPGDYLVRTINVGGVVKIQGNGARFIQPVGWTNFAFRIQSSDVELRNVHVDGRSQNPSGIWVDPYSERVLIEGCRVTNLRSTSTQPVFGIYANGVSRVHMLNNIVTNLVALPDGVVGNWPGVATGIFVSTPWGSGPGVPIDVLIQENTVDYIRPREDADAIRVLGSPLSWQTNSPIRILSNKLHRFGKRGVKLSCGGALVEDNEIDDDGDGAPAFGSWGSFDAAYASVSAYGVGNIIRKNRIKMSNSDCLVDLSSNSVHCSGTVITENRWELYPGVARSSNMERKGIVSYQSAATNVTVTDNFVTADNKGVLSFAPDQGWTIKRNHFFNSGGTGTDRSGAAIVLGSSINAYNVGLQADYAVDDNIYEHYAVGVLAYNVTNLALGTGDQFRDSGTYSMVRTGVDQEGNSVTYTNQVGGTYGHTVAARHGVFGEPVDLDGNGMSVVPRATGPFDIRTTARPILIAPISDESSGYARQENPGQWTYFGNTATPGWHDGYRWTRPLGYTHATRAGYQSTNWIRVAWINTSGLGNRYGAKVRIGAAGGAAATAEQVFRLVLNFGSPTLELVQNSPETTNGVQPLVSQARLVAFADNTSAFDVLPNATSVATVGVVVEPEITTAIGNPAYWWRSSALTNVDASLPAGVRTNVSLSNLGEKLWDWTQLYTGRSAESVYAIPRSASVGVSSNVIKVTADIIDIRGQLQVNGVPVNSLVGGGFATNYVTLMCSSDSTPHDLTVTLNQGKYVLNLNQSVSTNTSGTLILAAGDSTQHAVTVVKDQGQYVLNIAQ